LALERLDGWRALIVGDGPLQREVEAWAAGRPDRVRLVRGVEHARVPEYLAAMDLLCLPSLTTSRWREQFGRVLIEAMACGVAVVGSDSGEIPQVIGDAGRVVPEGDLPAWTEALRPLLADAALRAELSARAIARARSEYALPVVARRHLGFFEELLSPLTRAAGP
jgi:glycosyltransferase involved in cell wall biosynthesis